MLKSECEKTICCSRPQIAEFYQETLKGWDGGGKLGRRNVQLSKQKLSIINSEDCTVLLYIPLSTLVLRPGGCLITNKCSDYLVIKKKSPTDLKDINGQLLEEVENPTGYIFSFI